MRIAFISDIHGNAIALDSVLADIQTKTIDKVYILGDLCYRGPEPKRSLDLVRSLDTEVIKGNADEWVVRGVRQGEVPDKVLEFMNQERDWTLTHLDRSDIEYLEKLPTEIRTEIEGVSLHAFHATPVSLFEVVEPHSDDETLEKKMLDDKNPQIILYAHIHKPYIRYLKGKVILNIGSVGLPFDGLAKASYAIVEIEGGNISTSIQRVSFDVEAVIEQYKQGQYPNLEMMSRILRRASISL